MAITDHLGGIGLASLYIGLRVSRRHQTHLVPEAAHHVDQLGPLFGIRLWGGCSQRLLVRRKGSLRLETGPLERRPSQHVDLRD